MLLFAVLLVPAVLYRLYYVYNRLGGKHGRLTFLAMGLGFSCVFLSSWLGYAIELKPDTVALLFCIAALTQLLVKPAGGRGFALCFAGIFAAVLFKQQIIAPIAGMMLGVVISQRNLKEKLTWVAIAGAAFVLALLAVLQFDNAYFFAIDSHVGRAHVPLGEFLHAHARLMVLFSLFAALIWVCGARRESLQKICMLKHYPEYVLAAIFWLAAGVAGAINNGGTAGNIAVGMVLFLPLFIILWDTLPSWFELLLKIVPIFVLLKVVVLGTPFSDYHQRKAIDAEIGTQIKALGAKRLLISGDSYMAVRGSSYDHLSEIDAWAHIHSGKNAATSVPTGNDLIATLKPDAIVCVNQCAIFDKDYQFAPEQHGYREVPLRSTSARGILFVPR
jgi:hypothetical protein